MNSSRPLLHNSKTIRCWWWIHLLVLTCATLVYHTTQYPCMHHLFGLRLTGMHYPSAHLQLLTLTRSLFTRQSTAPSRWGSVALTTSPEYRTFNRFQLSIYRTILIARAYHTIRSMAHINLIINPPKKKKWCEVCTMVILMQEVRTEVELVIPEYVAVIIVKRRKGGVTDSLIRTNTRSPVTLRETIKWAVMTMKRSISSYAPRHQSWHQFWRRIVIILIQTTIPW